MDYIQLAQRANEQRGFTYDPKRDRFPTSGFAVSIFKDKEMRFAKLELEPRDLAAFVERVAADLLTPGACMGGWFNTDDQQWYLDVSVVLADRALALALARRHEQLAIYDLAAGETITLDQPAAPAP